MRRIRSLSVAISIALLGSGLASAQSTAGSRERCMVRSARVLGPDATVLRSGNLLSNGKLQCVSMVPHTKDTRGQWVSIRRGIVIEWDGKQWRELLRFDDAIRNDHGYIGISFVDPAFHYGFALQIEARRSDQTKAFTMYLTWLNADLQPEGAPVEVSWNPKVGRFQEYLSDADAPGFVTEVVNPRVRKLRR